MLFCLAGKNRSLDHLVCTSFASIFLSPRKYKHSRPERVLKRSPPRWPTQAGHVNLMGGAVPLTRARTRRMILTAFSIRFYFKIDLWRLAYVCRIDSQHSEPKLKPLKKSEENSANLEAARKTDQSNEKLVERCLKRDKLLFGYCIIRCLRLFRVNADRGVRVGGG